MQRAVRVTQKISVPVDCVCIEVTLTVEDVATLLRFAVNHGYFKFMGRGPLAKALEKPDVALTVEPREYSGEYVGHNITIRYRAEAVDTAVAE